MSVPHTIIQVARRAGGFTTFLAMVDQIGLTDLLQAEAKHTVFAPTDEAFAKFPQATLEKLNNASHDELLKAVVSVHLVSGQVLTERLKGRRIRGKSVEGSELVIKGDEAISVNGALIVRPDIIAANGVLHGIDKVLWPKAPRVEAEVVARG